MGTSFKLKVHPILFQILVDIQPFVVDKAALWYPELNWPFLHSKFDGSQGFMLTTICSTGIYSTPSFTKDWKIQGYVGNEVVYRNLLSREM